VIKKILPIFLLFLILSCSKDKDTTNISDISDYSNNTFADYELFERANKFINNNQFDLALSELDKIDVIYPSSIYANKSILLSAYINFLKKDYEQTRAIVENYKKYYPGSKDIVYANYMEAMTYYILIKKPNYSQKNTQLAKDKFNFILNAYPNSKYEIDVITKLQVIDNNLANDKLLKAKFYLDRKNYNATLIYLKDIFENFESTTSIEETLYYLVYVYDKIEEKELSIKYASILAYNFPNSSWYKKSYNLINSIVDIKKERWFESFNPIKIFIKNTNDDPNDSTVINID
jgi:outer membrane protein assembly factor BamD